MFVFCCIKVCLNVTFQKRYINLSNRFLLSAKEQPQRVFIEKYSNSKTYEDNFIEKYSNSNTYEDNYQ